MLLKDTSVLHPTVPAIPKVKLFRKMSSLSVKDEKTGKDIFLHDEMRHVSTSKYTRFVPK